MTYETPVDSSSQVIETDPDTGVSIIERTRILDTPLSIHVESTHVRVRGGVMETPPIPDSIEMIIAHEDETRMSISIDDHSDSAQEIIISRDMLITLSRHIIERYGDDLIANH